MTVTDVDVSRFSLSVDARDTVRAVLDAGDIEGGEKLDDAVGLASMAGSHGHGAFAVPPFVRVDREDFRPGCEDDVYPDVADRTESGVLDNLARAGLAEVHDLLCEGIGQTYLSDGRVVTAVRVLRPFSVVTVEYGRSHARLSGYADSWKITGRSRVVGTGTYLVGQIGEFRLSYVGATRMDRGDAFDHGDDTLFYWLVEHEGFMASTCLAGCDACGGQWMAESGSWHFQPEYGSEVTGFEFDDAEDADGATIECPNCVTGRVGFLVA